MVDSEVWTTNWTGERRKECVQVHSLSGFDKQSHVTKIIDVDSKYSIQRTLLQNRLVITNKKLQKINTKTFCASKKENEQMKESKTKKYPCGCICSKWSLRCKVAWHRSGSVFQFMTSCLCSLEIIKAIPRGCFIYMTWIQVPQKYCTS